MYENSIVNRENSATAAPYQQLRMARVYLIDKVAPMDWFLLDK